MLRLATAKSIANSCSSCYVNGGLELRTGAHNCTLRTSAFGVEESPIDQAGVSFVREAKARTTAAGEPPIASTDQSRRLDDEELPVNLLLWAGADAHRRVPAARALGRPGAWDPDSVSSSAETVITFGRHQFLDLMRIETMPD